MIQLPAWLSLSERAALQAFVAALHERFDGQVLSVRLFGSKARGDFDADSDVDDEDLAAFLNCQTGPGLFGDPHCTG